MTRTVDLLDRLIGFPTVSHDSNLPLIAFAEDLLRGCGFATTRIPDETGQKAGLHARLGPEGRGVMLSAHTDVVPVEGQEWSRPPFCLTSEGERLHGRGTTDMKGFLASVLALAKRAAVADLAQPLQIVLSYDEEIGCVGIGRMIGPLRDLVTPPRACIVGEPTGMQVATGHKGKSVLRATCHGEAGHSALAPHYLNALHLAAEFIGELRDLQAVLEVDGAHDPAYEVPFSTVHAGRISGGTALNIVPDRAVVDFEFRHLAGDDPQRLRRNITDRGEAVAARYRPRHPSARIEIEEVNAYPGLDMPPDSGVVSYVQSLARAQGTTRVAFGTEAGFLRQLAIPAVVCGPGDMNAQGHKPDEFITRDQLARCDAMMDRILNDLAR